MKRVFNFAIVLIAFGLILFSCAKDTEEPEPETPVDRGSFTYQQGSGASITADSAHYYPQFSTIYAFKNGTSNSIEMNLSSLSAGTYSFSSTTGNTFVYVTNATEFNATSGSCHISAAGNNRISGSFFVNFAGTTMGSVSGNFTNILSK